MKRKNSQQAALPGKRKRSALLAAGLLLASCSYSSDATVRVNAPAEPPAVAPDVAQYRAPLAGDDGDFTVTAAQTILNSYTTLSAAVNKGDKDLTVTDIAALTSPSGMPLKKGDLILVYQTQGATMDNTDDPKKYGTVQALNGAGRFEFINVVAVTGSKITISDACKGVQNNYQYPPRTQVIRVPQFNNLTINPGASVVAKTWDSNTKTGGMVALHVLHETKLGGTIDVTARGFTGGKVDNNSDPTVMTKVTTAVSKDEKVGASKGESIAGTQADYMAGAGNIGRGAPANGGGGGNAYKTGGGGGAGGGDQLLWTGHGVMDSTVTGGMMAWALDQAYKDNGSAYTTSTGGGRGGYAYSRPMMGTADPTMDAPGDAKWGIYGRYDVGGLGGHPLSPVPGFELFLGGGGGAGDQADASAGVGGSGGGVVILMSNTVTVPMGGVGLIKATGGGGQDTGNGYNDGAGGGGGGGAIFVLSGQALDSSVTLAADGGDAGSQRKPPSDPQEAEGPGGGGGGGVVVYMAGGSPTTSVKGQPGGTTVAMTMSKFPSNGATNGFDGLVIKAPRQPVIAGMPSSYPICLPADLQVTITPPATPVQPGGMASYDVTVKNAGENPALGADIGTKFPPGVDPAQVSWTCMPMGAGVVCPQAMGMGPLPAQADLPPGGSLSFKVSLPVPSMNPGPTLDLSVSAYPPPGYTDPDLTNNNAIGKAPLAAKPTGSDLKIQITVDKPNPKPGDEVTYTGTATNTGPDPVNKPVVVIDLPPGAVVTQPAQGDGWTCTQNGGHASCTRDTIPIGDAPPITVKIKIPDSGPPGSGTGTTTGVVNAPNNNDPNPGNNTSTVDTGPLGPATQADLALTITKDPTNGTTGMEVAYTLHATNKGPAAVQNPSVTFSVPAGSMVTQPAQGQGWSCMQSGFNFTCYLPGNFAVGDAPPITVKVNTPASSDPNKSPGAVAGVVSAPVNNDPNLLNNVASVPVINGPPSGSDLEIKITSSPSSPGPGDVVTYEGKASNKGPDNVKDPVVTINLPPGAEVVEEPHGDGWSCTRAQSTVLCTRESVPVGEAPPIIVKIRLPKDGSTDPVAVAVVSAPNNNDPVLSNNVARSELFRLVGGGYGCSLGGRSAPAASGFVIISVGLAIALGRRRRRSLCAA